MTRPANPCWDRAHFATVFDIEAGTVGRSLLMAVHQPPLIRRGSAVATEDDLAAYFHASIDDESLPWLVFLVGGSGSGKSHMVKWLHFSAPGRPNQRVVYVDKRSTSLRDIVSSIIDGLRGPKIDKLRDDMARTQSDIGSDESRAYRLMQEIAFEIQNSSVPADASESYAHLHLPDYLLDAAIRPVLLAKTGKFARQVQLAKPGSNVDVTADDLRILAEDLLVNDPLVIPQAAAGPQKFARNLTRPGMAEAAERVVNRHLEKAKRNLELGRTVDLVEVFREVRSELQRRGQELCLYIEELVHLNGIDGPIAQVLVEDRFSRSEKRSEPELCAVRAVVATTTGYLDDHPTLRTRGIRYSLDARFDDPSSDVGSLSVSFAARYLNAARLGVEGLASDDGSIPNACDTCDYQETCHPAFGEAEGFGLYPFRSGTLRRLAQLSEPERFDPRQVLRTLRRELEVADDEIDPHGSCSFPSARFASGLDQERRSVPVEQRRTIRQADPSNGERRLSLLAYWFEDGDSLPNPPADVLRSFDLEPLPAWDSPSDEGETAIDGERPPPPPRPSDEFENWANGVRDLSRSTARDVRSRLCSAVAAALNDRPNGATVWTEKTGREPKYHFKDVEFRQASFQVEDAEGGEQFGASWTFEIPRTDENAAVLQSVLLPVRQLSFGQFEALREFVDLIADSVEQAAISLTASTRTAIVRALASASPEARSVDDLRTGALRLPDGFGDGEGHRRYHKAALQLHETMGVVIRSEYCAGKSPDSPTVLDGAVFFASAIGSARLERVDDVSTGVPVIDEACESFSAARQNFVKDTWAKVAQVLDEIWPYIDTGDDLSRLIDEAQTVIRTAANHGLANPDAMAVVEDLRSRIPSGALELAASIERRRADGDIAVAPLIPNPLSALGALRDLLKGFSVQLERVSQRLTDAAPAGLTPAVSDVDVVDALDALAIALEVKE